MTVEVPAKVGDEWIYRLRDRAPSERVRVLDLQIKKTSYRAEVEFLDDDGRKENVPGGRLRRPWAEVAAYDELMSNWERIDYELTETEQSATSQIFDLLMPSDIATSEWSPVRYATAVRDIARLEELLLIDMDELQDGIGFFDLSGVRMLSPEGTLRIAEIICQLNPEPVLTWVASEEEEIREKTKRGSKFRSIRGHEATTSPEWEYEWYLKSYKPLFELLRQWCGHRLVTAHERLTAAEAEVRRLDILIVRLLDDVRSRGGDFFADVIEEEHVKERITPENVRPVVDRPLKPHEIPVREVPVRRRWGY